MNDSAQSLNQSVARVLRIGFKLGAGLLLAGIAIALIRQEPLATKADAFVDIPDALLGLHASAFIDLSIITIILTPVAAVVTIWNGFRRSGDDRFAAYSLAVIAILLGSIALSLFR